MLSRFFGATLRRAASSSASKEVLEGLMKEKIVLEPVPRSHPLTYKGHGSNGTPVEVKIGEFPDEPLHTAHVDGEGFEINPPSSWSFKK